MLFISALRKQPQHIGVIWDTHKLLVNRNKSGVVVYDSVHDI